MRAVPPALPAVVRGRVAHRRLSPVRHDVGMTGYLWLVDLAEVPSPRLVAAFPTRGHFDPEDPRPIRDKVVDFAVATGRATAPGPEDRVLMLAGARTLGHEFNPLSVHWCVAPDGTVRWSVLEVHNTYGQRHAQLLEPDRSGRASVPKEFYVSPFLSVDGRYAVRLHLSPDRVSVSVVLHQDGAPVLAASFTGRPRPATRRELARALLRTPLVMHQTSARIRLHGSWLWLRRLPVFPRPSSPHTSIPTPSTRRPA
ncbi:DUF1365 domain-containing protein [Ornithinicoccus hortensis]|uniref:DUF1365 family protein n=1 Tax=Ornithinicoccus hortensis TaxID=82346 RepID=A0A542YQT6_9MICO|nr:DUF1365 domain-containing protein [Ornithinicoccus hortensis]TQL50421.1 hypothetical protein FB467_1530 [Ornithinicoccus hortensis]